MPRVITNLLGDWTWPLGAASTNVNITSSQLADGFQKFNSTASLFRAIYQYTVTGCVAGKRYGFRVKVRNFTAPVTGPMAYISGGTGLFNIVGTWANNNSGADAVLGFVADCTTSGTIIFRFGVGLTSGTGTHPWSGEFGEVLFSEIPTTQSVPDEFIYGNMSVIVDAEPAVLNVGGFVVDGVGAKKYYDATESILVLGDSFSNDSFDWPQVVSGSLRGQKAIWQNGVSGRAMLHGITDAPSQLDLSAFNYSGVKTYPSMPSYVVRPKMVVVALGVNDINGNATLAQMQERFAAMKALLLSSGVQKIVFLDIPPWKNNASWTAPKEVVRAAYNEWIVTACAAGRRTRLFRVSDVLKDGTDPAMLAAAYDSGDKLHPNAVGSTAIATAITPYLMWGFGSWSTCDASLPTDGQIFKSHTAPIAARKITVFPGVASAAQIAEAAE